MSQDKVASESPEPAMDALRMNFLARKGACLVRGLIIKQVLVCFISASKHLSVNVPAF